MLAGEQHLWICHRRRHRGRGDEPHAGVHVDEAAAREESANAADGVARGPSGVHGPYDPLLLQ